MSQRQLGRWQDFLPFLSVKLDGIKVTLSCLVFLNFFLCVCFSWCMYFLVIVLRSTRSITCALLEIVCVLMA